VAARDHANIGNFTAKFNGQTGVSATATVTLTRHCILLQRWWLAELHF